MSLVKSLIIFVTAGLCEIGGGYLVWQWLRSGKPMGYGIAGGLIMALYGVVSTWQTVNFGKAYATYGGIFVVMSLLWAWKFDGDKPDKFDIVGALIILAGVFVIMYMPKK